MALTTFLSDPKPGFLTCPKRRLEGNHKHRHLPGFHTKIKSDQRLQDLTLR